MANGECLDIITSDITVITVYLRCGITCKELQIENPAYHQPLIFNTVQNILYISKITESHLQLALLQ